MRDFTMVFDAYSQCEEALLSARVAMLEDEDEEDDEEEEEGDDDLNVEGDDTELRLARLEDLMERRPVMVRLRLGWVWLGWLGWLGWVGVGFDEWEVGMGEVGKGKCLMDGLID